MLINGEKWACETCIKGHRATHCKHTDRKLISIKKKGRPSTQCKRCRELRIVRQLHVKCDCEDQSLRNTKKNATTTPIPAAQKKKKKLESLRPLAPKKEPLTTTNLAIPIPTTPTPPPPSTSSCCSKSSSNTPPPPPPVYATTPPLVSSSSGGCCGSSNNKSNASPSQSLPRIVEPAPLLNIPPPSSCCGPPSKNQQGEMIRVVTCRCGDDCACIGCDAHPSRAMKEGKNDVYIGFDASTSMNKRRLSIAAITTSNLADHPTSILSEDGVVLCGCGCSRTFDDCSNCFRELCQGYY